MISLTRLSGSVFALNPDLIERIDRTPDTVITLLDGSKYVVAESLSTVVAIIRNHRAEIVALSGMMGLGQPVAGGGGEFTWPPSLRPDDGPGSRRPNLSVVTPVDPGAASTVGASAPSETPAGTTEPAGSAGSTGVTP